MHSTFSHTFNNYLFQEQQLHQDQTGNEALSHVNVSVFYDLESIYNSLKLKRVGGGMYSTQ